MVTLRGKDSTIKLRRPTLAESAGFLLIAPLLVLSVAFEYWPSIRSFQLMFYDWNLVNENPTFIGLDNFRQIFGDSRFTTAVRNTVVYSLILIPIQLFLPLVFALVLRPLKNSKLSTTYRSLVFLPMVISLPAAAVVWLWMLNPLNGVINDGLTLVGIPAQNWLHDPQLAMASVIAVAAWSSAGFNTLLYLTGLEGVPRDVQEAAKLDGASPWQVFLHIEWPLISPTFFFIVITTVLFVNNEIFGVINILTKGGPYSSTSNVIYYLYERGFRFFQAGEASALAMLLVVVFLLVTWIQFKVGEKKVHYGS